MALLIGVSAIATTQIASAADMPVKAPMAPVIVPYNWTGFYVGANVGYTWGPWNASSNQIIFDPSTTHDPKVDGALGGLQAGYNWQSGAWVYGLEGDIQITGAKASDNWTDPGNPVIITELEDFLPGPPGGWTGEFHPQVEISVVRNISRPHWHTAGGALAGLCNGRPGLRRIRIQDDVSKRKPPVVCPACPLWTDTRIQS